MDAETREQQESLNTRGSCSAAEKVIYIMPPDYPSPCLLALLSAGLVGEAIQGRKEHGQDRDFLCSCAVANEILICSLDFNSLGMHRSKGEICLLDVISFHVRLHLFCDIQRFHLCINSPTCICVSACPVVLDIIIRAC